MLPTPDKAWTPLADIELRQSGVVHVRLRIQVATEDSVREIVTTVRRVVGNRVPCRILGDIRQLKSASARSRRYGKSAEVRGLIERLALLVDSPVTWMIGSAYQLVARSAPTIRMFTSETEALRWLED